MNLIYFSRSKLMFTDGILPVLMQIKHMRPEIKIYFLIFGQTDYQCIRKNKDIWEALQSIRSNIKVLFYKNRIQSFVEYCLYFIRFLFQKNIFIKSSEKIPHERFIAPFLHLLSKLTVIKHYHNIPITKSLRNDAIYQKISHARRGRKWRFKGHEGKYDYLLTPISKSQFSSGYGVTVDSEKLIYTGYPQRMPAWSDFLKNRISSNKAIYEMPYIFFVLSHLALSRDKLREPLREVLFRDTLRVFKKYEKNIRLIMKPHPNTKIDEVKKVIAEENISNFCIDYSHPMVLASQAVCVIGNAFSTVMCDAHFYTVPIIEYSQRDEELLEKWGYKSKGDIACDYFIHRDPAALDQAIDKCLRQKKIDRDQNREVYDKIYPEIPEAFYTFWKYI